MSDVRIEDLLTPPEAADMLGMRRASVYHIPPEQLPRHRIGERVFFARADVERFKAQSRRPGRPRKVAPPADAGKDA